MVKIGTKLFFLGYNKENDHGYIFITKTKNCLVHQKRKLATVEINKFLIFLYNQEFWNIQFPWKNIG